MDKVVTFGEILMRMSPPNNLMFNQTSGFDVTYGGGEFNVVASLANYGINTDFATILPQNPIAECAIKTIKSYDVGYKNILRKGDRIGIYFLENGIANRNSKVVYDRVNSSISQVKKGDIDWRSVFKDANWFHWSGITPALSENAAEACLEAIQTASKMGLTISTDLNYRSKLWKYGKQPNEVMPKLLSYSNVILTDIDTARFMLGKEKIDPNYQNETIIRDSFSHIIEMLPKIHTIAMTVRNVITASHYKIGGLLYKDNKLYRAKQHEVTPVLDRVGSGDAFMSGLLYGLLKFPDDMQKVVSFATGACVLKHSIFGDINRVTKEEILNFISTNGSAKVDR
ncbi:sugar kinase [Aquimarina algiphila]|uniref:sugar kinase n=1 Tax=Aquimarina algiphila TaxID=2047982 RepID=UPI002492321B|nr:sugar kinase [Aquimarina algiphila]